MSIFIATLFFAGMPPFFGAGGKKAVATSPEVTPEEIIGRKLLACVNAGRKYTAVKGESGKILFVCEGF